MMRRRMLAAALAATCLALPALARTAAGQTDVTKLKAIVTAPKPGRWEKQAAQTLRQQLGAIYGVTLPIRATAKPEGQNVILVGRAAVGAGAIDADELAQFKPDGFVVRAEDGRIALAGPRQSGTLYAATALLERVGYRYYAGNCQVAPKADSPILADFEMTDEPFFDYRTSYDWQLGASIREEFLGDPRSAENPELFSKDSSIWWQHTAGYLVPLDLYHKDHPEYFALRTDGTRLPKDTRDSYVHLCLSNPDVRRISKERLLRWISMQPDRRVFWVHPGDGSQWCQCENCKALDAQPGNYSDRLLDYVNELAAGVAKKYPGKQLAIAAYSGTERAPRKQKPAENVLVFYCPYYGIAWSQVHPLTHPLNQVALRQFRAWHKVAPDQMCLYDYNHEIGADYLPSWDAAAAKIKWAAQQNVRGEYLCGKPKHMRELFLYMTGRLLWDPRQDPEALKREFVRAYFGPAAAPVMEYLTLVQNRLKEGHPRGMHDRTMPASFYADGFQERLVAVLNKAQAAAGDNERAAAALANEKKVLLADAKRATAEPKPRALAEPQTIDGGLRLGGDAFTGGRFFKNFSHLCPARENVMVLYSPKTPLPSHMRATFTLAEAPPAATLKIEGQGSDKDVMPEAPLRVTINGRQVYAGPCTFRRRGWSWLTIDVPAGVLRKGRNTVEIANTSDRLRMDTFWAGIAEVQVLWK